MDTAVLINKTSDLTGNIKAQRITSLLSVLGPVD